MALRTNPGSFATLAADPSRPGASSGINTAVSQKRLERLTVGLPLFDSNQRPTGFISL